MSSIKQVAAGLVIDDDGRVLVARRAPGEALEGKWEFPGGKLEPGESAEECLVREFREEFGVEIEVRGYVASSRFDYDHVSIELLGYEARHRSGEFSPTVHDRIEWVAPENMGSVDFAEADLPIVAALAARPRN